MQSVVYTQTYCTLERGPWSAADEATTVKGKFEYFFFKFIYIARDRFPSKNDVAFAFEWQRWRQPPVLLAIIDTHKRAFLS